MHFGAMFGPGRGGTVATIDTSALSFTVTRPPRPQVSPSTSTTTSTTTAPAVTPSPTPVTVTTTSSTTYQEFQSSTFSATDAPVGTRIAVFGTRNADGSLTATTISVIPSGGGSGWHAHAPGSSGSTTPTPNNAPPNNVPPNAAARLAKAPFALGQVSAISGTPSTITLTTPWGTETIDTTSTTTFTSLVSTGIAFDTLAVGQRVMIRGQRQSDGDVAASSVVIIPAGVTPSGLRFGALMGGGFVNGPAAGGGPRGPWAGFGRFGWGRRPAANSGPAPSSVS
jgi:hypothetical protein